MLDGKKCVTCFLGKKKKDLDMCPDTRSKRKRLVFSGKKKKRKGSAKRIIVI